MKNKKGFIYIFFAVLAFVLTGYVYLNYPKRTIEDDALYKWISSETEYTYFKNDPAIRPTSEETERAHDNFMRIRFNKTAASVLDVNGRMTKGRTFPDSSIIVKEIYSDKDKNYELISVMVKLKGDSNSGADWLWAEYTPSGEVEYSVTKNGKACLPCHKKGDDNVRIFGITK